MSEAVLRIRAEGGGDVAALIAALERAVVGYHRRTEGAARGARERTEREERAAINHRGGVYRQSGEEEVRVAQRVTRFRLRQLAMEDDARRRSEALYVDAHRRATAAIEAETGRRGALTEREKRQAEDLAAAMVVSHEAAERKRTAATERESKRRQELLASAARHVAEAGGEAVRGAHGVIQGSRQEAAQIESTLAGAFGEGGATAGEMPGLQQRVLAFARDEGINPQDLAAGLQASQQQFSSLSGANPAERRAAMERALAAARLAHDTQSDPTQVMRLGGALGNLGSDDTITRVLRSAIGISRRGGVELGSLSQQNLSTIQSQMAAAVSNLRRENPQATEDDARRVMVDAFTQTLAQLEVLAPRGIQGKQAGTATRQLGSALHDPRVAAALRTRLSNEFGAGSQQVARFFNADGTMQAQYLDERGGERFGRAITSIAGGDPDRIRALLGRGTRAGDRGEILHANQRDMVAALAGQDAQGRTGWDALVGMREGANDVNDADVARTRAIVQGLDATRMTRAATAGMINARAPSDAQRYSDAFTDWATAHPMLSVLGGGALARVAGGAAALAKSRVVPAATSALGRVGAGAAAAAALPLAVGGAVLTYTGGNEGAGEAEAEGLRRARAHGRAAGNGGGPVPVSLTASDHTAIGNATATALQRTPLQAAVSPHDAVHASLQGPRQ